MIRVNPQHAHDAAYAGNVHGIFDQEVHDEYLRALGYEYLALPCDCEGSEDDGHSLTCGWGKVAAGDICRTPWEPSGLVRIVAIEPPDAIYGETAFVEFIEDHPIGYKKGTFGRYQVKELRPC